MKHILFSLLTLASIAQGQQMITGMAPVDIYANLEAKGFTTKKTFGREQSDFICTLEADGMSLSASIYMPGGQSSKVLSVSAMAQNLEHPENQTDPLCADFLGYVATLQYEGAKPEDSRVWVVQHIGQEAEAVIGGVRFQLFARGRTRLLRISPAPTGVPSNGTTFGEVEKLSGPPTSKDSKTGWAEWPAFKARFESGKVVQISLSK